MTYDEQQSGKLINDTDYLPPPPMPSPAPTFGKRMEDMGRGVANRIANAVTSTPFGADFDNSMGRRTYNFLKGMTEGTPTTNPSFAPMPSAPRPSFAPITGERPALQMPGLSRVRDFLTSGYENDAPGFREMPRSPYAPYIQERNTQIIPGGQQPRETPYPRPPFLNFSNWMDTGDRGPLPLNSFRPGSYPEPANRPMPEAYDTRTSGGFLADAGRAAMRGVAGQPMAQMYGNAGINAMQNVTNAMMLAEAAKTDDQRARESMRPLLDENAQAALEPLMMRKYAEKMGYMPAPGVWKRIWRAIVENYSQTEGGLTRGRPTPAPR